MGALSHYAQSDQRCDVVVLFGDASQQVLDLLPPKVAQLLAAGVVHYLEIDERTGTADTAVSVQLLDWATKAGTVVIYAGNAFGDAPATRLAIRLAREAARRINSCEALVLFENDVLVHDFQLADITPISEDKSKALEIVKTIGVRSTKPSVVMAHDAYRATLLKSPGTRACEAYQLIPSETLRRARPPAELLGSAPAMEVERELTRDTSDVLVSVIIRTTGRAELQDALASVAAQTYAPIELIIVDASGTGAVRCPAQVGHAKVKLVVGDERLERSRAANAGLSAASGAYLAFLDDDDWWGREHLARLVAALRRDNMARVAYAGVSCVQYCNDGWQEVHRFNDAFDFGRLLVDNFIPIHAPLFERSLLAEDSSFDEALSVYEDWDFWVQLARRSEFVHVDEITAFYRVADGSGFGIGPDSLATADGLSAFFKKWVRKWSDCEWQAILDRARRAQGIGTMQRQCQILEQQRDAVLQANTEHARIIGGLKDQLSRVHELIQSVFTQQSQTREQMLKHQRMQAQAEQQRIQTQAELQRIQAQVEQQRMQHQAELQRIQARAEQQRVQDQAELQQAQDEHQRLKHDLETALGAAERQRQALEQEYQQLEVNYRDALRMFECKVGDIESIRASTSWRLTAPLRALREVPALVRSVATPPYRQAAKKILPRLPNATLAPQQQAANGEVTATNLAGGHSEASESSQSAVASYSTRASRYTPDASLPLIKLKKGDFEPTLSKLVLPSTETPLVSVIIPVYNNALLTLECLASIAAHAPKTPMEVIVVDDGSTEPQVARFATMSSLVFLRHRKNLGFLRAVNGAAHKARGRYLLLLNNDTQVRDGWLDHLVELMSEPDVGTVGAKLVYPSGHLQEAGVCMRSDGSAKLVGLNGNPHEPLFNQVREVDYCSGACVLIEKALFASIGGFDERFAPAYFEDADLGFQVRQLGKKNLYCPGAEVVHHLSVTTGAQGDKLKRIAVNKEVFIEKWADELSALDQVRLVAFYLPQFHPIAENDQWWGKGFTEWTNVAKAKPNFTGHYQPHLPADLGFYDLRLPEIQEQQAALAADYGIHGFCYYYYWFNGRRLLEKPLEQMLRSGRPDFPFCICWANENWSRRWDGREKDLLITQHYSADDDQAFIDALIPLFEDLRYIRINGRPLLMIYRAGLLPDAVATTECWRQACAKAGINDPYLVHVKSFDAKADVLPGFDAAVEFPPHGRAQSYVGPLEMINPEYRGRLYDYAGTAQAFQAAFYPGQRIFRTVMPGWDNTARRQNDSDTFVNATPELYQRWLTEAIKETRELKFGDERLVFINAWNEWAEGNHLEPDKRYGHDYLEATGRALNAGLDRDGVGQ